MTTTSMIQPKFLSKPDELGVVAVGFSGGQVSLVTPPLPRRN
jgi:arginase